MTTELIILVIVVLTALAFDFTNGFHDTANAMASSIATGALKPKVAVALSAVLNLIGAFLSIEVAKTVGSGLIDLETAGGGSSLMLIVFTGLVGAILWNVFTWLLGLPSSSSHALFGGLIGATLASLGTSGVLWNGVLMKIIVPALMAPLIAGVVASVGAAIIYTLTKSVPGDQKKKNFRFGQISAASLMSLAHGTNDAQKTMGIIFLALVAANEINPEANIPFWVRLVCALAIALGTYLGGWRIIKTMGKGIVDIEGPPGIRSGRVLGSYHPDFLPLRHGPVYHSRGNRLYHRLRHRPSRQGELVNRPPYGYRLDYHPARRWLRRCADLVRR